MVKNREDAWDDSDDVSKNEWSMHLEFFNIWKLVLVILIYCKSIVKCCKMVVMKNHACHMRIVGIDPWFRYANLNHYLLYTLMFKQGPFAQIFPSPSFRVKLSLLPPWHLSSILKIKKTTYQTYHLIFYMKLTVQKQI